MLTRKELVELMGTTQTRYFHDNFKTLDHITTATTRTGYINHNMHDLRLETGIQSSSAARIYYTNPVYNPKYSILQMKVRINSMKDCFVFFGFCSQVEWEPAPIVLKVAGFIVIDGVLNSITRDGTNSRITPLPDIDLTDHWLLKIEFDKFSTRPLPIIYPYFDGLRTEKPTREWAVAATHGDIQPENEYHYLVAQIFNFTGANKTLEIKHITYSEEYAD